MAPSLTVVLGSVLTSPNIVIGLKKNFLKPYPIPVLGVLSIFKILFYEEVIDLNRVVEQIV